MLNFRLQEEFFDLAKSPSLLTDLKENVRAVESRWAKVLARLDRRLTDLRERLKAKPETESQVDELDDIRFNTLKLSSSRERQSPRESSKSANSPRAIFASISVKA